MASASFRIISDVHYGDQASRVRRLAQLRPLADGVDELVCNGDMLDTRPGPRPQHTLVCRAEVEAFAREHTAAMTFLTGNHDPDFSTRHMLALAADRVVLTHGDIVFDDIVPWGRDAAEIRAKITAAVARLPGREPADLEQRFALWRAVAASTAQRHQSEPRPIRYALRFAADTIWPPLRILRVLRAWRTHPKLVGEFARTHWPAARFILVGHTHRPGITSLPDGRRVINTGSFCAPFGGCAVEVRDDTLTVRRVELRGGEFRLGPTLATFPLAAA